ncbi:MAG: long-chain fatty acid--CoA ligase [Barnesiella sp.]|nr:long-chain fatty acid--CoA ligase [Barnesiella sp.]
MPFNNTIVMTETLLEIYARSFKENWDLPALSLYGQKENLTYANFAEKIARLHLLYRQLGINQNDKIALLGKNTPSWIVVFFGTLTYGATIVPILQDFNPVDAQHIINHSDARLLFVADNIWEQLDFNELTGIMAAISIEGQKILAERDEKAHPVGTTLRSLTQKFRREYPDGFTREDVKYPILSSQHLALINYTSGTTGFSKGVMLTHDNLLGNVSFGIEQNLHFPGSRCLSFLPLAHAYGCTFDMLVPLAVGTHITIFGKVPTPVLLMKALAEVRPNLIVSVPLVLEKIYRKKIVPMLSRRPMRLALAIPFLDTAIYSKIRKQLMDAFGGEFSQIIIGGAPLNREVEEFLLKIKFPVTVGYGMTECAPLISYSNYPEFIPGSCGRTLPNMETKIDSADQEHIPGEICTRGQNVMVGYYKNPQATEDVIDKDGWLHTGDMGLRNPDGVLFIRGRYKTMLLSANGQNIYPEEIEAKMNNMPFVSETVIVQRGNGLVALVYPDLEQLDANGVTVDALDDIMEENRKELNKLVAPYEQIAAVELRSEEFEKTPKKSIKRYLYS